MDNKLDAGIPLLTEVIATSEIPTVDEVWEVTDVADTDTDDDNYAQSLAAIDNNAKMMSPASASASTLSPQDWEKLQSEIHRKVLEQLHERINLIIEQRMRESIAAILQSVVAEMAQQIKITLQHNLNDVVFEAISLELSKFQNTTK